MLSVFGNIVVLLPRTAIMFKNYVAVAYRNLLKHKGYTLINILGLGFGMGCCLFLFILDQYAFSFNAFHENAPQIYRLTNQIRNDAGSVVHTAQTPPAWGPALADELPEIEGMVRFEYMGHTVGFGDRQFRETFAYVDADIFEVFTYPLRQGDPKTALVEPNSIVLAPWMAKKYFGEDDPIGQTLLIDNNTGYRVTGVFEELPENASFGFSALVPFTTLTPQNYSLYDNWTAHSLHTYFLLPTEEAVQRVQDYLPTFIQSHQNAENAARYTPVLQPLLDIYLHSDLRSEHGGTLNVAYVYIFTAIAVFILLIAGINFVNLATARAAGRAREVGMRKVLGALKQQIVGQFLAESLILTLVAGVLAVIVVEITLPAFGEMADWRPTIDYIANWPYTLAIVGIILLVGLLGGSYPAFYLSAYKPVEVLKGQITRGNKGTTLRKALVVSQFTVAIFLIVGTVLVYQQLDYVKNKDMGFNEEHLMMVVAPQDQTYDQFLTIRSELLKHPSITDVTIASTYPTRGASLSQFRPEGTLRQEGTLAAYYDVDEYYLETLGMELIAGRNFRPGLGSDSLDAYIVNETAVRRFGWDDPLGKQIAVPQDDGPEQIGTVVGVVKDFHYQTMHQQIRPLLMRARPQRFRSFGVRVDPIDLQETRTYVSDLMKTFDPSRPPILFFIDDAMQDDYETEDVIATMLQFATYLTILIACLGLLGLSAFMTMQRAKEVGIRKVLGSSIRSIILLLSKDFILLIGISFLIAAPLAYFGMNAWLQDFAYRIDISMGVFIVAGILAIVVSWATIGYQAIRAALANPVDALRME